VSGIITRTI